MFTINVNNYTATFKFHRSLWGQFMQLQVPDFMDPHNMSGVCTCCIQYDQDSAVQ